MLSEAIAMQGSVATRAALLRNSFHCLRSLNCGEFRSRSLAPSSSELLRSSVEIFRSQVAEFAPYSTAVPAGKPIQVQLRILKKDEHGLRDKLIPASSWRVLTRLLDAGYRSYLVGGSVRDMLVKQVPKDFDILTTAEPKQVKAAFSGRCIIVGRRFPVCHVTSLNTVVEVSSFSTNSGNIKRITYEPVVGTEGWSEDDFSRWDNSLRRDFTVNGIMYDPFKCIIYDYVGGLRDLRRCKIRTVIPALESFEEDSARILRAIRIAARLEFSFATSTANAIRQLKSSILTLNKTRLQLEVNTMMAYGSSERSVRLLWRYGVLEYLLPFQARYFSNTNLKRQARRSDILLKLLANLDKVTAPNRPCHGGLWVAILAFHLALVERPWSLTVGPTVALALSFGTGLEKAITQVQKLCDAVDKNGKHLWNDQFRSCVKEMDEVVILNDCQSFVDLCLNNVAQLHSAAATCKVMQELNISSPPSDWGVVSKPYFYKANHLFNRALTSNSDDFPDIVHDTYKGVLMNSSFSTNGGIEDLGNVFSHVVLSTLFPSVSSSL
ncbi:uncharacterized protein [Physcomitrium patens]|uniref:Poly A polymerase head domain-containing protein n=2 Tax=Physcomitrium patens TaxID=3218 RepID=A0A2K1JHF6_PHYPA|nr:uncharacterized protein LOC112291347 [Physcomitrium patens]PNR40984.1 hypothetical protein PHYPA_018387 [Physcomitrium patens]|eukprot:XP_024394375.1 uncharacterized protein LOC112291347 [Physcomitrella patens]